MACPDYLKLVIDGAELDMRAHDIEYAATDRAQTYEGSLYRVSCPWAWEHEVSAQHGYCFDIYLSGIPLPVIRKGLGPMWSPPLGVDGRT